MTCLVLRRAGKKARIANKQKGYYWDVFVYSEKDLRKLSEQHLSWKGARILFMETADMDGTFFRE
jgi:hypothetical protein